MAVALERELDLFHRELPILLAVPANVGRYVLIGGDPPTVVSVYSIEDEALAAAYERFGFTTPFLVKRIAPNEEPKYFSRNIRCPM